MDLQLARSNMIEQQVRPWDVLDQRVLDVLAEIPREAFVDASYQGIVYSDFAVPIGFGQTMLKPTLDGRLLQAISPQLMDHVLEIGTGSGYLTACLARLSAQVESIEIVPELASRAGALLSDMGVANASIRQQNAADEWDARDSYEAILFSGSVPSIPVFYKNKMSVGGRLVAVVGEADRPAMEAVLITRVRETEWTQESLFETRIDPLLNFDSNQPDFVF